MPAVNMPHSVQSGWLPQMSTSRDCTMGSVSGLSLTHGRMASGMASMEKKAGETNSMMVSTTPMAWAMSRT